MKYALVVLTHGDGPQLEETLETFYEHVTPRPFDYIGIRDGGGKLLPISPDGQTWRGAVLHPQQGFCAATRCAWRAAVLSSADYVFWLEHDFRFFRPLALDLLAHELDEDEHLAQMALVRQACNTAEEEAGGLVRSWPFPYWRRWSSSPLSAEAFPWLLHRGYFTTTPSLMRTDFMRANPWPRWKENCEGRFGAELVERGYSFGAWGGGEPWVEHTGERTGFGY